jgi:predicted HTH domain antitoxin
MQQELLVELVVALYAQGLLLFGKSTELAGIMKRINLHPYCC